MDRARRGCRLGMVLLAGCQPTVDVDVADDREAAVVQVPTPVAAPPAPLPAEPPAPVAFTAAELQVRVLARLDGDARPRLHAFADRRLLVEHGARLAVVPTPGPIDPRRRDGGLAWFKLPRATPRSYDNLFSGEHLELLGGRWPALALVGVAFMAPRTGTVRGLFRRNGAGWKPLAEPAHTDGFHTRVVPWTDDRVLALHVQDQYSSSGAAFMPSLVVYGSEAPAPTLPEGFAPHDLATTPAGDVFVVATRGDSPNLWALRWDPAGGPPRAIDPLPEFPPTLDHTAQWFITATSATAAHVTGGYAVESSAAPWLPYVAAFTGEAWTELATPVVGRVGSQVLARDGSLWLTGSEESGNNAYVPGRGDRVYAGGLWRRSPDGAWTRVSLRSDDSVGGRPIDLGRLVVAQIAVHADELCMLAIGRYGPATSRDYGAAVLVCAAGA